MDECYRLTKAVLLYVCVCKLYMYMCVRERERGELSVRR